MTQRNIDIMDRIVDELVSGKKISEALSTIYTTRRVIIRSNVDNLNIDVRSVGMSNRTVNALLRTKLQTLKDVVEYAASNKITNIKNLGQNSGIEVFETILNYYFDSMTIEEKTEFLIDVVERNVNNLKV